MKILTELKIKDLKSTPPDVAKKTRATEELIKRKTPLVITSLQGAKMLISRVILNLQQDAIPILKAKALMYAISVYISCYKEVDFENRLAELEKKLSILPFDSDGRKTY